MTQGVSIVGVGATPYTKRGVSAPQTMTELVGKAIIAAADDAGLAVTDIDGFAFYANGFEPGSLMETLGIPEINYSAVVSSKGGGSAGIIDLAMTAIVAKRARTIVCVGASQQLQRYGNALAAMPVTPEEAFLKAGGMAGPGHAFALLTRRHMHRFGTRREALAEVAISTRENALNRETAMMRTPLTLDQYFAARMIADPLCLYDFCLETDGAIAFILTDSERAKDLKQKPVHVAASAHGGTADWGRAFFWMNMPDDDFTSSGSRRLAERIYREAGIGPADIDVALLYDHFSPMVIMQLEDYQFCKPGEGGPFVESGAIRFKGGSIPVNTHGGHLSEAYIIGMTHIKEAVDQLRGVAVNQVRDAQYALVTGGPAPVPVSGAILRTDS